MANLPTECWVLTSADAPYIIKEASPSWHALWQFSERESVGKPISKVLNGPRSDRKAGAEAVLCYVRDGHAKTNCINQRKDGTVVRHKLELEKVQDGILGTSRGITLQLSVRDLEVFHDGLPVCPPTASTLKRTATGRDREYFDDEYVLRLGTRDSEVFEDSCLPAAPPLQPVKRTATGRDREYFDDEYVLRLGTRDSEVFEDSCLPAAPPLQPVKRTATGRDREYFAEDATFALFVSGTGKASKPTCTPKKKAASAGLGGAVASTFVAVMAVAAALVCSTTGSSKSPPAI